MIAFDVLGEPRPQGNMRAVPNKYTGKTHVVHKNEGQLLSWRQEVARACQYARGPASAFPSGVPLRLYARFYFVRPKSVSAKKRPYHTTKPDLDKLVRAVKDACSKGVGFHDDAQVVAFDCAKEYAELSHAQIIISPI